MYIKYIKNNTMGTACSKKGHFFQLTRLVDKTTLNSHLFNEINDFVTSQYFNTIFYPFYPNRFIHFISIHFISTLSILSLPNEDGINKVEFSF